MSTLEQEILTLLLGQELYGLQIRQAIYEASNGSYDLSFGSLYPSLKRLEEKSFVKSRWGDEPIGARRKYYRITKDGANALAGRQRFLEALSQWQPKN